MSELKKMPHSRHVQRIFTRWSGMILDFSSLDWRWHSGHFMAVPN
jgi:hypothetical protein